MKGKPCSSYKVFTKIPGSLINILYLLHIFLYTNDQTHRDCMQFIFILCIELLLSSKHLALLSFHLVHHYTSWNGALPFLLSSSNSPFFPQLTNSIVVPGMVQLSPDILKKICHNCPVTLQCMHRWLLVSALP